MLISPGMVPVPRPNKIMVKAPAQPTATGQTTLIRKPRVWCQQMNIEPIVTLWQPQPCQSFCRVQRGSSCGPLTSVQPAIDLLLLPRAVCLSVSQIQTFIVSLNHWSRIAWAPNWNLTCVTITWSLNLVFNKDVGSSCFKECSGSDVMQSRKLCRAQKVE